MRKFAMLFVSLMSVLFCTSGKCQTKAGRGPEAIVRNIIQDKSGVIWVASFQGIFRYNSPAKNGETGSFTLMTSAVSNARFFSLLQDSKGKYWFGSIGDGVYRYDGKTFQHFTIREGLLNDEVGCIYEDSKGRIWFGVSGGASCYDGKKFWNYVIEGETMKEDSTGKKFISRSQYEVTDVLQDKNGKFWLTTRGNTFVFDETLPAESATKFEVVTHDGKPFRNVRNVMQDRNGNIWLGGNDGLWRYDGTLFTNITSKFTGYIIEDKNGNIWTSAEKMNIALKPSSPQFPPVSPVSDQKAWALSRYDAHSLNAPKPAVTEIAFQNMFFGILEAADHSIWVGSLDGVYRFDGKSTTRLQ